MSNQGGQQKAAVLRIFTNNDVNLRWKRFLLSPRTSSSMNQVVNSLTQMLEIVGGVQRLYSLYTGERIETLEQLYDAKCVLAAGKEKLNRRVMRQMLEKEFKGRPVPQQKGAGTLTHSNNHSNKQLVQPHVHVQQQFKKQAWGSQSELSAIPIPTTPPIKVSEEHRQAEDAISIISATDGGYSAQHRQRKQYYNNTKHGRHHNNNNNIHPARRRINARNKKASSLSTSSTGSSTSMTPQTPRKQHGSNSGSDSDSSPSQAKRRQQKTKHGAVRESSHKGRTKPRSKRASPQSSLNGSPHQGPPLHKEDGQGESPAVVTQTLQTSSPLEQIQERPFSGNKNPVLPEVRDHFDDTETPSHEEDTTPSPPSKSHYPQQQRVRKGRAPLSAEELEQRHQVPEDVLASRVEMLISQAGAMDAKTRLEQRRQQAAVREKVNRKFHAGDKLMLQLEKNHNAHQFSLLSERERQQQQFKLKMQQKTAVRTEEARDGRVSPQSRIGQDNSPRTITASPDTTAKPTSKPKVKSSPQASIDPHPDEGTLAEGVRQTVTEGEENEPVFLEDDVVPVIKGVIPFFHEHDAVLPASRPPTAPKVGAMAFPQHPIGKAQNPTSPVADVPEKQGPIDDRARDDAPPSTPSKKDQARRTPVRKAAKGRATSTEKKQPQLEQQNVQGDAHKRVKDSNVATQAKEVKQPRKEKKSKQAKGKKSESKPEPKKESNKEDASSSAEHNDTENNTTTNSNSNSNSNNGRKPNAAQELSTPPVVTAVPDPQRKPRVPIHLQRFNTPDLTVSKSMLDMYKHTAARRIQAVYRGYSVRKKYAHMLPLQMARRKREKEGRGRGGLVLPHYASDGVTPHGDGYSKARGAKQQKPGDSGAAGKRSKRRPSVVVSSYGEVGMAFVEERFKLLEKLGDGNFADVRKCTSVSSGEEFAMKIIYKNRLHDKRERKMIANEVQIMREVSHPHIIELFDVFETDAKICLVLELVHGGDLFDRIVERGHFTEKDAKSIVHDLATAIEYLHAKNIVHRDLKPENILVASTNRGTDLVKLGDFGLSMHVEEKIYTICGTPTYVAPEIISKEAIGYGLEVDLWALGVITYILLCGFPPFSSPKKSQQDLFNRIRKGTFTFPDRYWAGVSAEAKQLIRGLLRVDAGTRTSATQVLRNKWITMRSSAREEDHDLSKTITKEILKNFPSKQRWSTAMSKLKAVQYFDSSDKRATSLHRPMRSNNGSVLSLAALEAAEMEDAGEDGSNEADWGVADMSEEQLLKELQNSDLSDGHAALGREEGAEDDFQKSLSDASDTTIVSQASIDDRSS